MKTSKQKKKFPVGGGWNTSSVVHDLLFILKKKHFFATGTVRDNRTGNCNLKSLKLMAKEPKGTFDFTFDYENEIGAVRWCDNAVVTIMSNVDTIEPIHAAKRYDRKQKNQ